MTRIIGFALLVLATTASWLFAAISTLPAPISIPWWNVTGNGNYTVNGITVNDDTDEVGFVVECPKTGTLTSVAWTTATITTGEASVPLRLETIDASGNPSGTLINANGTGTVTIADGDDNVVKATSINGGTGISVTRGQIIAVRMKRNAIGALNGAVFRTVGTVPPAPGFPSARDYNVTAGAAWTKLAGAPMLAFNIGGWVSPLGCMGGVTTVGSEAIASAAERGILINFPVSVRAIGAIFAMNATAATTVKASLYSAPTGSPVLAVSSNAVDTDAFSVTTARLSLILFTATFTLDANTNYVVALSPQDATTVSLQFLTSDATYAASYPSGSTGTWYARASGGATSFTETTTRIPIVGLIIDGINTGGETAATFAADLRNPRETKWGKP